MNNESNRISTLVKGILMGWAEVVPGVSGGTIAFITGIYERLLASVSSFGPGLIRVFKEKGLKAVWEKIDGNFLTILLVGMALGLGTGVFGITFLLEHYKEPLWAFFFGLILASSLFILKMVPNWNIKNVLSVIIGIAIAYTITVISPTEGDTSSFYILLSGMLAISALMLPGISGSFVLLLMGMYSIIIPSLKSLMTNHDMESFRIVAIFGIGCLVGLSIFSKVLTWLFKNHRNLTFSLLGGFLIGSLNKVWPWRNVTEILLKEDYQVIQINDASALSNYSHVPFKILQEVNVLPSSYQGEQTFLIPVIVSFIVGFILVFALESKLSPED